MILDWRPSSNLANHLGAFFLGLALATLCHGIFTDDMAPREIAWGTSFLLLGLISFAFGFLLRHRKEYLAPWGLSSFGNGKAWFSPSHPEDSNENADSRKLLSALMAADMNLLEFDLSTGRTITPAEFFEPLGFSKGWKPPSLHDAIKVLVHPDDRALFRARVESLRRGKREHFRMEGRVVLGRGERLWCQCDAVVTTDPETRERRLLFFLQDITERIDAREQLEASRTRYESLVEDMPLLQCMSDSDGKLTFVNHSFAEYFGRQADALVGKNFSELIPASWADYVRSETEQITLQEPIRVIEHPVKHPDGSLRKVRWTVRAFFDEMDRRIRLQGLGEDITELMEMEDRLLRSRQRLKLAVESGEVGLWEWDLIHDMVTFNDVARMMVGVGEGELHETLDCVVADLLHPDDARGVFANAQAYLQGTIDHYECTFRLKHRDGSWRWVLSRGRVTERTAEGKPIRMAGTHSDITNLIQVQEELEAIRGKAVTAGKEMQRQRDMLNALIHSAPEGLLFKDIEGTILQCNPVVCRMLGKDPDELLHRKCSDIFPGNRGRGYEEDDQRVLQERKTLRKREALRDHQGRRIIVDKIKSPCFDQRGELLGSLTIAHDITESFRSEALNRASGLLLSRRHDYEKSLSQVLSLIGEATSVDRIRLFRVQRIPGSHRYRAHFLSQFDTTAPNEPVPVVDDSFPLPAISAPLRLGKIAMYQGELFEAAFAKHFPGLPTHSLAAVPHLRRQTILGIPHLRRNPTRLPLAER